MTITAAFWFAWVGLFLAFETIAIFNRKPGDTLSEYVWQWFSVKGHAQLWRLRRFMLLAFLAWLSLHLLTGGQF